MSTIEDAVCDLIQSRAALGLAKYGVTVERTDLSELDWLKHARDEACDLAIYLTRLIRDKEAALQKLMEVM